MPKKRKKEKRKKDKTRPHGFNSTRTILVNVNVKKQADKRFILGTVCNEGVNQTEPFLINHIYSEFNSVSFQQSISQSLYDKHTPPREREKRKTCIQKMSCTHPLTFLL